MSGIGPLRIVVCIKISPDTALLGMDPQTRAPKLDEATRRIGTFDENALEEAVRLKERHGGQVVALSLATEAPPPEIILKALAMGADEAQVIEDTTAEQADSLATARILSAALLSRVGRPDLIICGEGSLDAYSRQVGPRLAEALGVPVLSHVTRIENRDGVLVVHRAFEDREVIVEAALPILITVGQEINQPRFPTVLQIMGASRKPHTRWRLTDLGFDAGETAAEMSGIKTLEVFAPSDERRRIPIEGDSVGEMARTLVRTLFEQSLVRIE